MKYTIKTSLSIFLLLTWVILAFALYSVANLASYVQIFVFPSWQSFLVHLSRIAPVDYIFNLTVSLAGVTIFSLACIALGLQILKGLLRIQAPEWVLGVSAFVIGEIFFSLIFLTLISLYHLTPLFVAILLSGAFLIGFPEILSFFTHYPGIRQLNELTRREKATAGLAIIVLASGLLLSSARLGYDAVATYFSHAKIMAVSQKAIFFYPSDLFVVSSFHSTSLFTAVIQLFGDQAARMLSWVNGVAIVLLGLAIGKEIGLTVRARLWFLVMMVTSTAFIDLLGDGKVELISTVPLLAAVYWMLRSTKQLSKAIFTLIGLLAGFAIIARPYNIFLAAIFILFFYAGQAFIQYRAKQFNFWGFVRSVLWLLPPILALGIFDLFQNWIWLKSPLAPLAYAGKLSGNNWQWQFDPRLLNVFRLFYPFIVTFFNSPQSLGNITPLFVAILPFLLVKEVRQKIHFTPELSQLILPTIATLLLWIWLFFTVVEIRYVLFLWTLLFLPTAQILEWTIQWAEKPIRIAALSLPIALIVFIGIRSFSIAFDTYSPIDSKGQPQCYDTYFCTFLYPINQTATLGDRVLVLSAYRYYLRSDLFACSSQAAEYPALETLARQNSPDFWVEAYRKGFRFVAYEKIFSEQYSLFGTIPNPKLSPSWLHVTTPFPNIQNSEIVYFINAVNPPFQPTTSCRQNLAGIWEVEALSNSGK